MIKVKSVEEIKVDPNGRSFLLVKFDFDNFDRDDDLLHSFDKFIRTNYSDMYSVISCNRFVMTLSPKEQSDFMIFDFLIFFSSWIFTPSLVQKNK